MGKQNIWPITLIALTIIVIVLGIKIHFYPTVETVEVEKMTEQEQTLAHIEQLNIAILGSDIIKARFQKEKKELYDQLGKDWSLTDRTKNPKAYLFVLCWESTDPTECTNIGKQEESITDHNSWWSNTGFMYPRAIGDDWPDTRDIIED